MKRIGLTAILIAFVVSAMVLQDAFARNRVYHPGLGRFLQRDPVGYRGGMSLYQYVGSDPAGYVDPFGLLQRRQVDYLGKAYVDGWPGIGPASRAQVQQAIRNAKDRLRQKYPKAGFTAGGRWTLQDDRAMQKVLNAARKGGGKDWAGFPGDTYRCLDCKDVAKTIKDALKEFNDLGGKLGLDENLLLAWMMKESTWNTAASAYGSSAARSTATGLLQITKTTYNDYASRGLFSDDYLKKYGDPIKNDEGEITGYRVSWDEDQLTQGTANAVAGQFILQGKPGRTVADKLGNYYGSSAAKNRAYANSILAGKRYLDQALKGKSLDKLSDRECQALINALDRIVHPR
jgi:hypothetical protein